MPIPKNWLEELAIEWLQLKGYLVESNLPVSSTPQGGRNEVDIVGAKACNGKLDIIHIEAGMLAGGKKSIESLQKKFSKKICGGVEDSLKKRLNFSGEVNYQKIYLASYWTEPTIKGATEIGITVKKLPDFICKDVLPTIEEWKQNPPHQPRTKDINIITLPEGHWLLCLIDSLTRMKLLKCPH